MMCSVITGIPLDELYPHPDNPRKDIGDITELTKSIKTAGMIYQNLTVIRGHYEKGELVDGGYTILMGHRRCAAAKEAGMSELPCKIIDDIDRKEQIAMMLEENMQRNDLTIFEQADSFQMMLDLGETVDTLAKKTGFSKQTVKHRVEMAKLDKDLLKEKAESEYFQMSIKDIYELEKIEDVETRNKILKDASSSDQIAWKVSSAIKEAERKEQLDQVKVILENMGIEKAPKGAENQLWSGKWDEVKSMQYKDILEQGLKLRKSKEPYYWAESYGWIKIIKKHIKSAKETEEELKKKQAEDRKKELKNLKASLDESIKDFIIELAKGRIKGLAKGKEDEILPAIWRIMINSDYSVSTVKGMIGYLEYKDSWSVEIKDINSWDLTKVSTVRQMIICVAARLTRYTDLFDYNCHYKKEDGTVYQDYIEILTNYGFGLEEEQVLLVFGEHELYEKDAD